MKYQLDFEKPILELQRKLDDLKKHPEDHSLSVAFEEEVGAIDRHADAAHPQRHALEDRSKSVV